MNFNDWLIGSIGTMWLIALLLAQIVGCIWIISFSIEPLRRIHKSILEYAQCRLGKYTELR